MSLIAAKFGGSSVADTIQIRKVKAIVESDLSRRYIVVSAPGKRSDNDSKITDMLYMVKTLADSNVPYEEVLQVVKERFLILENDLGVNADIDKEFTEIKIKLNDDVPVDYLVSRGEYLCAKIIAGFLGYDFIDAAGLVLFDEKGKLLYEETNAALKQALAGHLQAVIPGFYGTQPDGNIKTFSRGGSDITGSLVARAVDADIYENWTDVSGFLMADPKIVENPKKIRRLNYRELRELSHMGASVLHENAISPARLAGIPIKICNTNRPKDSGTVVSTDDTEKSESIVKGITGKKNFTIIDIHKNMMHNEIAVIRQVLSILEDYRVPIEHIPSDKDLISLVIEKKYLEDKLDDLIYEFGKKIDADSIEIIDNISLIATVGQGLVFVPGVESELFGALSKEGINARAINQNLSEISIIVGVKTEDFEAAICAIYKAFSLSSA